MNRDHMDGRWVDLDHQWISNDVGMWMGCWHWWGCIFLQTIFDEPITLFPGTSFYIAVSYKYEHFSLLIGSCGPIANTVTFWTWPLADLGGTAWRHSCEDLEWLSYQEGRCSMVDDILRLEDRCYDVRIYWCFDVYFMLAIPSMLMNKYHPFLPYMTWVCVVCPGIWL